MPRKHIRSDSSAHFWARVDQSGGSEACWPWTGAKTTKGYGSLSRDGRTHLAHRIAFALARGPYDATVCVLHACDNPPCCNPGHLWLGTRADNNADRDSKGRGVFPEGDANGARRHPERLARGDASGARLHPDTRARGDRHGFRLHPETSPRGERNGNAKLVAADVIAIRSRAANGAGLRADIANYTDIQPVRQISELLA